MAGNAIGRPTLLDEKMLEKAKHYLVDGFREIENLVPSTAGLCCYLGVSKSAVYVWSEDTEANRKDPIRREFMDTLEAIQTKQEMMLANGGLSGAYNSTITKLMLANHGYSDSVKQDLTSNGQTIGDKPTVINLVGKTDSD